MEQDAIFKEGISISKKFKSRNKDATERLYDIIKKAIILVQAGTPKEREEASAFMIKLYTPHMRKIAMKAYKNLRGVVEYEDVLQEAYTLFLTLLERYNSDISAFSYYIGVTLPQRLSRWVEKEVFQSNFSITTNMSDVVIPDTLLGDQDAVDTYLNAYVFTKDYEKFILDRAEKQSRSQTGKIVCHKYFLGGSSCSDIARDIGISYNAVYEIIGKIKEELKEFLVNNAFSDFKNE